MGNKVCVCVCVCARTSVNVCIIASRRVTLTCRPCSQTAFHHHHKHQGLDPLIRSVSRVTTALANVSSVFQLFSFLVVCSDMISKGFGLVAFFASVKASSVCIHLSCPVCIQHSHTLLFIISEVSHYLVLMAKGSFTHGGGGGMHSTFSFYARSQHFEKRLLASSCLSERHGTTRLPLDGFS